MMIKLEDADYTFKPHLMGTDLTEEVIANLSTRSVNYVPSVTKDDSHLAVWDPGGMLMVDDEMFEFDLGSITLGVRAQHFEYFVDHLSRKTERGTKQKYYKLHTRFSCIVLSPEEFNILQEKASNPELLSKSRNAWNRKNDKLNELHNDPNVNFMRLNPEKNKQEIN